MKYKCNRCGAIFYELLNGKCADICGGLLVEVASEAQPVQPVSPSASCSEQSASDGRNDEADSSSRSAQNSGPASEALLACPFCGSRRVQVRFYNQPSVCCEDCLTL